jgi:flavin-dependent dehydrogenase
VSRDSLDVAIVGGGPAGAVAARVLARRGLRVVVLESAPGPRAKAGETLPPSVAPLLRKLGLDAVLPRNGHLPAHGVRAHWGSGQPGENPFLASPYGAGWHVDRAKLEARLAEAAVAAGVDWRWSRPVSACRRRGDGWRLETAEGVIDTRFVADATGRHARVARRLGARRVRYDRLVGLFAVLRPGPPDGDGAGSDDGYTVVEAVEDGWWYSARLAGGGLAVCRFGDGDLLPAGLRRGDPAAWRAALAATQETRERAAGRRPEAVRVLPAESSRLDTIDGDGWIALGDAAAAYDPLSSQGIASALGSGYYGGHAVAERLAGPPEAAATARLAYRQVLERIYAAYLDLLRAHYAREHRWPRSPFWHRRRAETFTRAA